MPDRLVCVSVGSYDKMVREYRIRIDEDMIFLPLASLESKHYLLRGTVFPAQKASSFCDVFLVQLCCRRYHTGGIELKLYRQTSRIQLTYTYILQSPEVIARQLPS